MRSGIYIRVSRACMSHLIDTSRDISVNIENTLIFALVASVNTMLLPYVAPHTILMMCVLLFLCSRSVTSVRWEVGRASGHLLMRVNVILFSDAAFRAVSVSVPRVSTASIVTQVIVLTHSTVLLLVLAMLNTKSLSNAYTQRMATLVLFMYTENIQKTVGSLDLGIVATALALLVYAYVHKYQARIAGAESLQYVVRAVNMLAINTMLTQFTTLPYSLETKTMLLLAFLLFLDLCSSMLPMFLECRGYALWKAAQYMQVMYEQQFSDPVLSLFVSAVVLCARRQWPVTNQSFAELVVLICVNVVVVDLTSSTPHVQSAETPVALSAYIIVLDIATSLNMLD